MTEMAETHVELNQFPVPRVGPRHSTHACTPVALLKQAFLLFRLPLATRVVKMLSVALNVL